MTKISLDKLLKIVNSCQTEDQLESCRRIAKRVKEIDLFYYSQFSDLIKSRDNQISETRMDYFLEIHQSKNVC